MINRSEDRPVWALRDLYRVDEVERLLELADKHPNPLWAPEQDQAQRLVDVISQETFGITKADTYVNPERRRSLEAQHRESVWEQHFEDGEGGPRDLADVSCDPNDVDGRPLRCVDYFHRQIICSSLRLMGHPPRLDFRRRMAAREEEAWAAKMERDALNFRPKKRG